MRSWMFQANPQRFDIDGFLALQPGPTCWLTPQYSKDIRVGDEVFIWRAAAGNPKSAGVIAKGYITAPSIERADDPNAAPFWKSAADGTAVRLRAGIQITEVATKNKPLQRSLLHEDATLASLNILHWTRQTNYVVTEAQSTRLNRLWANVEKAWTRPLYQPAYWRMAMRVGENGFEMYDECFELGVAAITYDAIATMDFTQQTLKQAEARWSALRSVQKSSLRALVFEMRAGDIIYVKQGARIVGKGIIRGALGGRAYAFSAASKRIVDPNGTPWAQQVRVSWMEEFLPLEIRVGSNQRIAIQRLRHEEVERIESAWAQSISSAPAASEGGTDEEATLSTESYFRATSASLKIITRRHNELSNAFSEWLARAHKIKGSREKDRIDIRFAYRGGGVLAELKICFGIGTRHAIREALGQLFEYNYYPPRAPADVWMIILDHEPDKADRNYVDLLRSKLALPMIVGWKAKSGFSFHPSWP